MSEQNISDAQAEILQPSEDINNDVAFFTRLGFRLNTIFPDDNPAVATLSGYNILLRLDKNTSCAAATIYLLTDNYGAIGDGSDEYLAPNGTIIKLQPKLYQPDSPATQHKFEVRQLRDSEPWVIGRAGMLYRDLIPDRLGGSIIASHIRIPDGGPVPDMVHYHTIGFQLIYCYRGWVKLVYEDQGPPFILKAGDCVTQPPEIRHRVLEASDNLEVIEIGVPAEHMTTIDHNMDLPNKEYNPEKEYQGQTFCHHLLKEARWQAGPIAGLEYRDTGINQASNGVASVIIARPTTDETLSSQINHNADIYFAFVLNGGMDLEDENQATQKLHPGDAFVIPPQSPYKMSNFTNDLELLQVTLPGKSEIIIH